MMNIWQYSGEHKQHKLICNLRISCTTENAEYYRKGTRLTLPDLFAVYNIHKTNVLTIRSSQAEARPMLNSQTQILLTANAVLLLRPANKLTK